MKKRNELIRKYSIMLQNGEITPSLFLATLANRKNHVIYEDGDICLDQDEVDIAVKESELYGANQDDVDLAYLSDSDTENTTDEEDDTPILTETQR